LAGKAGITGHADGHGANATFNFPGGVAMDHAGSIAVLVSSSALEFVLFKQRGSCALPLQSDYGNNLIRSIDLSTSEVRTIAGIAGVSGASDGFGTSATFDGPAGVAMNAAGTIVFIVSAFVLFALQALGLTRARLAIVG
jgi:hypothetical protein